jgi:UDP-N-acetylmuramoyl-tripeptide--D-alanyl-D-alanine ligase
VGVTGSSGKTTTKYFIGELIKAADISVRISSGNLNTKLGLALEILGFDQAPKNVFEWFLVALYAPIKALFTFKYEKYLVLEYGMDHAGDINKLTDICSPDIAVITNIGLAHIEILETKEKIIQEKWVLAQTAKEAVITDKQTLDKVKDLEKINAKLYIVPSMKYAKAENAKKYLNRVQLDFYLDNKKGETDFHFFGEHNIRNLEMAAFAAFLATGDAQKILKEIDTLVPLTGRGRRIYLKKLDILVLDESYNANPSSMKAALSNLGLVDFGRKVAILGEMGEIGPIAEQAHLEIAREAKKIANFTVGVGEGFKDNGLDIWYKDVSELNGELAKILKKGDLVLIKGSLSNNLEKTVKYLEEQS